MTTSPLTLTLDASTLSGKDWLPEVRELLELAERCDRIDVRRTAGLRRESSLPIGTAEAERRLALANWVPGLVEAWVLGASLLSDDESHLVPDGEPARFDQISLTLWNRPPAGLEQSDLEDVAHLNTHDRHGRDVFVTTDQQMTERRRGLLGEIGIRVATPAEALMLAREACDTNGD